MNENDRTWMGKKKSRLCPWSWGNCHHHPRHTKLLPAHWLELPRHQAFACHGRWVGASCSPHTPPQTGKKRQQQQKGELIPMIYEKFPQIWAHFLPNSLFLNMFLGNLDKFMPKSTPSKLACKCHSFFGGQCHKLLETNSLPSKKDISSFNHLENMMYHNFRQLWLVLGVKLMEINSNLFSNHLFSGVSFREGKTARLRYLLWPWPDKWRAAECLSMWDTNLQNWGFRIGAS